MYVVYFPEGEVVALVFYLQTSSCICQCLEDETSGSPPSQIVSENQNQWREYIEGEVLSHN